MKILLTGASSFTGYWFVRRLAAAGHDVVATFRGRPEGYQDVRRLRVDGLAECCQRVFDCEFGGGGFMDVLERQGPWDLLCHHAADVSNYKSPDFDVLAATAANTRNIRGVLKALRGQCCRAVVLTGSAFECDEGLGGENLRAFSPYGLSKAMTAQAFRYFAPQAGVKLGKFVIPNPFGPMEEPRFTTYLARTWLAWQKARVAAPDYVRDNIHVDLLARCYERFCRDVVAQAGGDLQEVVKISPSGYVGSQGTFTALFAEQMRPRLGVACEYDLGVQTQFPEPRVRINSDLPDAAALGFDEKAAWDELARYYRSLPPAGA